MNLRNEIQKKLLEVDKNVYYGMLSTEPEVWDYIVFGQRKIRKKDVSSNDLQCYWSVAIVRENFIPDDVIFNVIEKVTEINGVRLADGDFEYDYITKGSTDIVVEIVEIQFTKTKKPLRCD